jgi:hypothetical protein
MNAHDGNTRDTTTDQSDGSHVAANLWRLLAAAQRAGGDPLSDLASTLSSPDAAPILLRETIDSPDATLAGFGEVRTHLEHGAGIELLRAMRARAKRDLGPEQHDPARRRAAMLAFGLVVAASLTQHGIPDTRASRESVEDLLLALCSTEVAWVAALGARALTVLARIES